MTITVAATSDTLDYDWLRAEVASILHRANLTDQIPKFILLAEKEINRKLRWRLGEVDEPVTLVASERTIALPERFIEQVSLNLTIGGQDNDELTHVMHDQLRINTGTSARPCYWAVNGSNIEFPNPSDANYTLVLRMIKGYSLATTGTNDLMTEQPGIYLYGACYHAAPWMGSDARIPVWKGMFEEALREMNAADARTKGRAPLRTEHVRNRQNIITGQ